MKLEKISSIRVGLPLSRKKGTIHDDLFYNYRVVTLKSFSETGTLLHNELDDFIAIEELNKNYITQAGDILVRLRSPNLAVYIDQKSTGLLVSSLIAIIKPKKTINSEYLTHFINSNLAQRDLEKELQGTTVSMLKAKELSELEIVLPLNETQEKVVAMLNLASKEIELLEKLSKLKKQFKSELFDTILKKEINK